MCIFSLVGIVRRNGNLELYNVDVKDAGNYSCFVSYIDPDNEESVHSVYVHVIRGELYKITQCVY